jgi:hypothetical protein
VAAVATEGSGHRLVKVEVVIAVVALVGENRAGVHFICWWRKSKEERSWSGFNFGRVLLSAVVLFVWVKYYYWSELGLAQLTG